MAMPRVVTLQDVLSSDIPLDILQQRLRGEELIHSAAKYMSIINTEHSITLSQDVPRLFLQDRLPPMGIVDSATTYPLPFMSSLEQPEHNLTTVDVNELSASLGLPGMKCNITAKASPVRTHASRPSQGLPDALYGKLMGRALDKPLTADTLAGYMSRQIPSSDNGATMSRDALLVTGLTSSKLESRQAMKIVGPPPGFGAQPPRRIIDEEYIPAFSASSEQKNISTGPASSHQSRRSSLAQSIPHHERRRSSARRPRAHTRVKRSDQGPEPSFADIYPEDANYVPTRRYSQPYVGANQSIFLPQLSPQREIHIEDAITWPTPAEVYRNDTKIDPPTYTVANPNASFPKTPIHILKTPPTFSIFDRHFPPTSADIDAADIEVLTLMSVLPNPAMETLLGFGASNLWCDERALTPSQLDGKRYGMKYHGIGIGDTWICPFAEENVPFRVRPRDHDGWGGWQWALERGWGDG